VKRIRPCSLTSTPASSASAIAAAPSGSFGSAVMTASAVGRDSDAATRTASRATPENALTRSAASFCTRCGTGSGAGSLGSVARPPPARAISIAKNGLPPEASAIRAIIGRVGEMPLRDERTQTRPSTSRSQPRPQRAAPAGRAARNQETPTQSRSPAHGRSPRIDGRSRQPREQAMLAARPRLPAHLLSGQACCAR
jgi:hypothetical protein